MMNARINMIKTATTIVAGSILLLSNVSIAHGQDNTEKRDEVVVLNVPYTSESLRDPFESYIIKEVAPASVSQFADEAAVPLPPLTITGITWGSSFPQAIVNGKIVKAGDMIAGVQVVSISKDGLVLLFNKQHVTLPAPGAGSVKK